MTDIIDFLPEPTPPGEPSPPPVQRMWIHGINVALWFMSILYIALDISAFNDPNPLQHLVDSGLGLFAGGLLLTLPTIPIFILATIAYPRIRYIGTKRFARIGFILFAVAIAFTIFCIFFGGYLESDAGWSILHH